jgi:hypothetical protein
MQTSFKIPWFSLMWTMILHFSKVLWTCYDRHYLQYRLRCSEVRKLPERGAISYLP